MTQSSVTIVTSDLSPRAGGVYEAILGQAFALRKEGRLLRVISVLPPDEDAHAKLTWLPAQYLTAKMPLAAHSAIELVDLIEATGSRIIHAHGMWIPSISIALRIWRGRSSDRVLVLSPHGMLDPWALRNSRWKKRLAMVFYERATLRVVDCIHALNRKEAESIRDSGVSARIVMIPNGVDLQLADATPQIEQSAKKKVLLFLGRLHPKKGLDETLQAWKYLKEQQPAFSLRWCFVIAGWDDGGYREILEQRVAELGLSEDVIFSGPTFGKAKQVLLSSADAFILASHSEGMPMSVLEAWANALPVFMTQSCNLPEGFDSGAAVEITTDPRDLARTLLLHLERPDLRSVGKVGRDLVETRFSWEAVGDQFEALYTWLAGSRSELPECIQFYES